LEKLSWKDHNSEAESQGLSVLVRFPMFDSYDVDANVNEPLLDIDEDDDRPRSLVTFGNLDCRS